MLRRGVLINKQCSGTSGLVKTKQKQKQLKEQTHKVYKTRKEKHTAYGANNWKDCTTHGVRGCSKL